MAKGDERSVAELKRSAERSRAELTETVGQLRSKVSETVTIFENAFHPTQSKRRLAITSEPETFFSTSASDPLQTAAIGVGLAIPIWNCSIDTCADLDDCAGLFLLGSSPGQKLTRKVARCQRCVQTGSPSRLMRSNEIFMMPAT